MGIREVRRWSIDFGKVLVENLSQEQQKIVARICPKASDSHPNFMALDNYLRLTSLIIPEAMHGLYMLIKRVGSDNVWIVSHASGMERIVNRRIFAVHFFWEIAGMRPENIIFVDHFAEKAGVCRSLGIGGHIDDRGEALVHMRDIVPLRVWFNPSTRDLQRWENTLAGTTLRISGWREIIEAL